MVGKGVCMAFIFCAGGADYDRFVIDHSVFVFFIEHRPECFCASNGLEHSYRAGSRITKVEKE